MRVIGLLAGVGSLLHEARQLGYSVMGNFEPRTPYRTGRHLCWDLNFPKQELFSRLDPGVGFGTGWYGADLALGHPPCGAHSQLGNSGQPADLSLAERRTRQARRHARVGLLPLFVEAVRQFEPKSFALDNLPKILTTVAPPSWWHEQLPQYRLTFLTILNWDYGTPQLRKRLWVIGIKKPGKAFVFRPTKYRRPGPTTALLSFGGLSWQPWVDQPVLGHVHVPPHLMLTGDYRTTRKDGYSVKHASELALGFMAVPPDRAWPYTTRFGRHAVKIGRQRLDPNKYSRTTTGLPSIHHPLTGWPLTARERARLLDWPDDFQLGGIAATYDRFTLMRLTLLTGKAIPSGFPRYLLPQLRDHLGG